MKNPKLFLSLLLTNFDWTIRQPVYRRAVVLTGRYIKDAFTCTVVRALVLFAGDWRAAVEWLRMRGAPPARLAAFRKWAEKLTAPARRGLLLANGGAL